MNSPPAPGVGAQTLPYLSESVHRAFEGIAAAGMDIAGLYPADADGPLFSLKPTAREVDAVRASARDAGLRLVSLFAHHEATMRPEQLETDLRLCADLEVPFLLAAGPWPFVSGEVRKPEMAWYAEVEQFLMTVGRSADLAGRLGVTIVLKPHRGATATGVDLVAVLERIGSPAVGACWDAGNIRYYEGVDSEADLIESGVASWVRSVSIKDHRGAAGDLVFPVPGEGDVDHRVLLQTLLAAGFDGPLLAERFDQPDATANDRALVQTKIYFESLLDQLERRPS